MLKKSKIKRILTMGIAVVTTVVSVSASNVVLNKEGTTESQVKVVTSNEPITAEMQENTPSDTVTTYFHEATGTLIISGTGVFRGFYPLDLDREWPMEVPATYDTTIKHIVIEKGITEICNCFNGLKGLESVSLPEGITNIDDSFMECTALESIDFPETLEKIGGFSFADCSSLKNIDLKNNINISGGYCGAPFNNCDAVKEVCIPGGSYLYSAFSGCSSLENVYIGREGLSIGNSEPSDDIEEFSPDCFGGCHDNLKLHYVEGTLDVNADHVYWDRVYIENMPDKVALKVTTAGININWNGRTGADVYHLYRKAKGDKKWKKIADTKLTYYDDNAVKSGVEYSYLIKVDDDADKLTSSYTRFLGAPKIKSAAQTKNGIKLNWNKIDGAKKYRVYRKTSTGDWKKLADVTGTTYADNKAKSNVRYYYTVRAFGKTGYGAVDKTYPYVLYLEPPEIKSIKKTSEGVVVSWDTVGCQGYYLYRKEAGGSWKRVQSTYSNESSLVDETAKKGVVYTYTVRAFVWDRNECLRSEYLPGVKFKY